MSTSSVDGRSPDGEQDGSDDNLSEIRVVRLETVDRWQIVPAAAWSACPR